MLRNITLTVAVTLASIVWIGFVVAPLMNGDADDQHDQPVSALEPEKHAEIVGFVGHKLDWQ